MPESTLSTVPVAGGSVSLADLASALRAAGPATLMQMASDQAAALGDPSAEGDGAPDLPTHVLARLPSAQSDAQANADQIERRRAAGGVRQLHQALAARVTERHIGPKERLRRLRRLYDAWAKDVYPSSACRTGCSHCCHIGVAVTRAEAELISEETRIPLQDQQAQAPASALATVEATRQAADELALRPRPCTFLSKQGRCTIYASRPLACRQLHNLDVDDLLCRLIPGVAVPVPYADATEMEILSITTMRDAHMADIRAWFGEAR
jgi:uncharacterized protein